MKTSARELRDITKAWIAISIAFSVILTKDLFSLEFIINFLISGLTVGLGFLLHELGHKVMAQKYGCFAEFRSFDIMLILAIIMSFFGFVFAAPGAVMISGRINEKTNGKISLLGPLINFILAGLFFLLSFQQSGILNLIGSYGYMINAWLGLFNMIPFWQFDGVKIYRWNKLVYFLMIVLGITMLAIGY